MIEVGSKVSPTAKPSAVGEVYAIRPGNCTGKPVYSVKFDVPGKNRSHGFYYEDEIMEAQDAE